jgi:glycosyltransferase involved in cell wall biosynthesis
MISDQPMSDHLVKRLDHIHALIESGRIEDAVALLGELTESASDSVEVWFTLGRARGMLGHDAEAEAAFARVAQLRPEMHEAHLNLALSRVYQSRLRDAIPAFVAARRLKPDSPGLDVTLLDIVQSVLQSESGTPVHRLPLPRLGADPLVSVVVPTRNRVTLLRDALESVARQIYRNWEIIVVNDGGEDVAGVIDTLPEEAAAKISALRLRASAGPGHARNRALQAARGEVIAFLDDDDVYLPGHLATLVAGLSKTGAGVAYSLAEKVSERLDGAKRIELQRDPVFHDLAYSRDLLLVRNFIPIDNWAIRRSCFEQCGAFDETLACMEDWDLLLRLSERSDFHRVSEVTAEVRVRKGTNDSVSSRTPALSTYRLLYERYPGRGNEWINLARELHLNSLFRPGATP